MTRIKKEPTPPRWSQVNSKKLFMGLGMTAEQAADRVADNNRVRDALKKFGGGFSLWDSCNIWENGHTITCRKTIADQTVFFGWHWSNQGGDDFMRGHLSAGFQYYPNEKYMRPWLSLEINDITEDRLTSIVGLERGLRNALQSQHTYDYSIHSGR